MTLHNLRVPGNQNWKKLSSLGINMKKNSGNHHHLPKNAHQQVQHCHTHAYIDTCNQSGKFKTKKCLVEGGKWL